MSCDRSTKLDGCNEKFFQVCWTIIEDDIVDFFKKLFKKKKID